MKLYNGADLQSQRIVNLADPSSATDGVNKQYVDNKIDGLAYKEEVRAATTTNGTLATAYENGDTVDGVTLGTGDRLLLKVQTDPKENGIYIVAASGAPTRATDANSTADLNNATVYVTEGTTLGGTEWTQTTKNPVIATDNIVFVQKTTGTAYVAGAGLNESPAGTFNVTNTDGSLTVGADTVSVASQLAGAGLTLTAGVLDVVGDASITVGANSLGLATGVSGAGLTLTSGVLDVVGDASITVGANSLGLATGVAGAGLTLNTGVLAVVGASGGGITVNANDLAVDSTVARVFSIATHASTTSIAITHSLGKQFVVPAIFITSTGEQIWTDAVATSTTVMTFTFAVAPSANTLTFVITG